VVVLANRDGTLLPNALVYEVFDRYLAAPKRDWSAEMLKVDQFRQDIPKQQEKADEEKRVKGTKPTVALGNYAGEYTDDLPGPLVVTAKDGKLIATFHAWTLDLEHWHYDTFRASDQAKRVGKFLVSFVIDTDGKVSGLKSTPSPGDDETLEMKR